MAFSSTNFCVDRESLRVRCKNGTGRQRGVSYEASEHDQEREGRALSKSQTLSSQTVPEPRERIDHFFGK